MIDIEHAYDYAVKAGGVLGIVGALIIGVLRSRGWAKRKSSEDGVAIATGTAEVSIIQRLQEEAERQRLRADRAFEERNDAVSELGSLKAQVESLTQHKIDCERRLAAVEARLDRLTGKQE